MAHSCLTQGNSSGKFSGGGGCGGITVFSGSAAAAGGDTCELSAATAASDEEPSTGDSYRKPDDWQLISVDCGPSRLPHGRCHVAALRTSSLAAFLVWLQQLPTASKCFQYSVAAQFSVGNCRTTCGNLAATVFGLQFNFYPRKPP